MTSEPDLSCAKEFNSLKLIRLMDGDSFFTKTVVPNDFVFLVAF
jgi:hypothetical protein